MQRVKPLSLHLAQISRHFSKRKRDTIAPTIRYFYSNVCSLEMHVRNQILVRTQHSLSYRLTEKTFNEYCICLEHLSRLWYCLSEIKSLLYSTFFLSPHPLSPSIQGIFNGQFILEFQGSFHPLIININRQERIRNIFQCSISMPCFIKIGDRRLADAPREIRIRLVRPIARGHRRAIPAILFDYLATMVGITTPQWCWG